jgi:Phage late control gene D protein (GPD).
MGDLMSGFYSNKVLSNKYGNFLVPAYKIKISGTDLVATMKLSVAEMVITLSLNAASSAIIKFANLYDEESHSFDSSVKGKFKLGTVTEIEIGYLSTTTMVFKGYVAGLGVEFDEYPLLTVQLMDARRLMMASGKKHLLHDVKNYSDAFTTVMNNYSRLCSPVVDATNDNLVKPLSQTTNDYNFVTKELIEKGKAPREFFILGDKAYFREPAKNSSAIMNVQYGRELLTFSMMSGYLDMKVVVSGYDSKLQKAVSATAAAKSKDSQSSVISSSPEIYFVDPDADSQEKAKTRATAIAQRELNKVCTGNGTLVGLPEIVPGRFLEVESLDSMADKKYYITEVVHTIDTESFTTSFEIGGWG